MIDEYNTDVYDDEIPDDELRSLNTEEQKKWDRIKPSNCINVAEKMRELIATLKMDGFDIPLAPECEEEWNENYAIVDGFYFEPIGFQSESPYMEFNQDQFRTDLENKIKAHFGVDKLYREGSSDKRSPWKDELVVRLYYQSQEIEVYYQGQFLN